MDSCIDTNSPLFSVIIPCYNCENKIDLTLRSVCSQSLKNFELIIIDDSSTDNTLKKIEGYKSIYANITILKNSKNLGVYESVDRGVGIAKGKYISLLAAGDYYDSSFLKEANTCFHKFQDASIWCCDLHLFKNHDEQVSPNLQRAGVFYGPEIVVDHFKTTSFWIHGMAVVLKKEFYLKYGKFPRNLGPQADWFLFHLIALQEGIAHTASKLAFMELDDTSYSRSVHLDRNKRNLGYWKVLHTLYNETSKLQAKKFIKSGLLTSISDTLFWKLIRQPKYWGLLKHSKSSTSKRLMKSLSKKVF